MRPTIRNVREAVEGKSSGWLDPQKLQTEMLQVFFQSTETLEKAVMQLFRNTFMVLQWTDDNKHGLY